MRKKPEYTPIPCKHCHTIFTPTRSNNTYCCQSCVSKAYQKRKGKRGVQHSGRSQDNAARNNPLASITSGLAANAITGTAEYLLVTKPIKEELKKLSRKVDQLHQPANQSTYEFLGFTTVGEDPAACFQIIRTGELFACTISGHWYISREQTWYLVDKPTEYFL